ncbi:MAG: helix-turn-helix domain-containing protein [Candidatus Izemoplasmatales bacterium]
MASKFERDLKRRREEILRFYYLEIGSVIRKRRLEMNMTQEELSRGIFSHTYLSKIENNAIAVNKDSLYLIMERVDMSNADYILPEEMLEILEKAVRYFFLGDIEGYRVLVDSIHQYEYGILIDLTRFGYHVLSRNFDEARRNYEDLHRYLVALEDYGFTIYAIFAIFYLITVDDIESAKKLYEQARGYHAMTTEMFALFEYAKFIIYGRLEWGFRARDGFENAKNIFLEADATIRVREMSMYLHLFRLYEGQISDKNAPMFFHMGENHHHHHEYLILSSMLDRSKRDWLLHVPPSSKYYPESLFARCVLALQDEEETALLTSRYALETEINERVEHRYLIDWLDVLLTKDDFRLKDFLIQELLPRVTKRQHIPLMRKVTEQIVTILAEHKRYKDSYSYLMKLRKAIRKIQGPIEE